MPSFGSFAIILSGGNIVEINQPETIIAYDYPRLLTNQDKMSILNRESSVYASYQVSVHLAKWLQRRLFLEIDKPETNIATRVIYVNGYRRKDQS